MPGWHAETLDLVAAGALQVAGILQEQHGDRARLFHQWKRMDFPLMVDSFNELGVKVVPIHILLDAQGRVALINPRPAALRAWLEESTDEAAASAIDRPSRSQPSQAESLLAYGTAEMLQRTELTEVMAKLRAATQHPEVADRAWFRLGVVQRMQFEQSEEPADFAAAVEAWGKALALDPNQYIWRRRIQQYGPRLDKPYPFYDWVAQARSEIEARDETPIALAVEPAGAELAAPIPRNAEIADDTQSPTIPADADQITRDDGLILADAIVVPDTQGRPAARLHLSFRPNPARAAYWNNEVEPARLWLRLPDGWRAASRYTSWPGPDQEVSDELRRAEFEVRFPADLNAKDAKGKAVLLAHVCEGVDGTCVYRRIPVTIQFPAKAE